MKIKLLFILVMVLVLGNGCRKHDGDGMCHHKKNHPKDTTNTSAVKVGELKAGSGIEVSEE